MSILLAFMRLVAAALGVGVIVGATSLAAVAAIAAVTSSKGPLDAYTTQVLSDRHLTVPVSGVARTSLRESFDEIRGSSRHEAIDIAAMRGTPVVAVDDGRIAKLFSSKPGGLTVYQFDGDQKFAYYYAHLDRYAEGLKEGMLVKRGDVLGYVGTTGNAAPDAPHLHFTIFQLGPDKHWWHGIAIDPFPFLVADSGL